MADGAQTVRDPPGIVLSFTRRLGRLASRRRGAISKEGRASGAHDPPRDASREAKTQWQPGAANEHDGADLMIGAQEGNADEGFSTRCGQLRVSQSRARVRAHYVLLRRAH